MAGPLAGAAARVLARAFASTGGRGTRGPVAIGGQLEVDQARFRRDMDRLDRTQLHRARVRALVRLATGFREDAAAEIRARGLVDRGRLVQGLAEQVDYLGGHEARVVSAARHTRNVLDGRRPGAKMPPIKPLARWARRKLGVKPKEARGAAFLIARAIHHRGIPPKDFVTGPYTRMAAKVERVLLEEYRRAKDVV